MPYIIVISLLTLPGALQGFLFQIPTVFAFVLLITLLCFKLLFNISNASETPFGFHTVVASISGLSIVSLILHRDFMGNLLQYYG